MLFKLKITEKQTLSNLLLLLLLNVVAVFYLLFYCLATHRTRKKIDGLLQQFSALEEEFLKMKKQRIAVLVVSYVLNY